VEGEFVYLRLEGIDSRENTTELIGDEFIISPEQLIPAREDTFYPFQLIGLDVFTEDQRFLGKLSEIYQNPMQTVWEVRDGSRELLIPASKRFIREIDLKGRKIIVRSIEGLSV